MSVPTNRFCDADEMRLVERCINGEKRAWDEFIRIKGPFLSGVIQQALIRSPLEKGRSVMEDILQEVFVSLLKDGCASLKRFQWNCSLNHYLATIATRRCIDHWETRHGFQNPEIGLKALSGIDEAPLLDLEKRESQELLKGAMDRLPFRERLVLQLFYWRELSAEAIGTALGLKPNSVWSYLARSRDRLRDELLKKYDR